MKLLLFDIDGTLLTATGIGRVAIDRALAHAFGRPIRVDGVRFCGRTDPQILGEILTRSGVDLASCNGLLDTALTIFEHTMHEVFDPTRVHLLPGVKDLIQDLSERPDVLLGLLTGNLESIAYLKLRAVGLDGFFRFGAFGSDHADRRELPAIAARRAQRVSGRMFAGTDVVIVGDTEHDITCGSGIGAFSVAVCTGRIGRAALTCHAPDLLLDDLRDTRAFTEAVLGSSFPPPAA
jgi:phosphoglycolate phosphatase